MADVKWIKITTDIFDDEKILLIESLPDAYSIIVVWFKLLCLAGKQNNSGVFLLGRIAYTEKMLATIFRMKETTVQLALQTFEQFGMIEIVDGVITIPNWGKHQNLEQLEERRKYQREYQKEYRKKQKALMSKDEESDKHLRKCLRKQNVNSPDIDIDKDLERDKEKEGEVIDILPEANASATVPPPPKEKPVKTKGKHKYGEYKNVLLTDEELEKLKDEFPDYEERIERLSSYVASTGKSYKSHYATIRHWARSDQAKAPKQSSYQKKQAPQGNVFLEMLEDDLF